MSLLEKTILALALIPLSCGSSGSKNQPSTGDPQIPGTNFREQNAFILFELPESHFPQGSIFDVWIQLPTKGKILSFTGDSRGRFRIPLNLFLEGDLMRLDIVKQSLRLGTFDWSSEPGLQPFIRYRGGLGMDLGTLKIEKQAGNELKEPLIFSSNAMGGFSVVPNEDARLEVQDFEDSLGLKVRLKQSLTLNEPYASFLAYHTEKNPWLYQEQKVKNETYTLFAHSPNESLQETRLRATSQLFETFQNRKDASLWSLRNYKLDPVLLTEKPESSQNFETTFSSQQSWSRPLLFILDHLTKRGVTYSQQISQSVLWYLPPLVTGVTYGTDPSSTQSPYLPEFEGAVCDLRKNEQDPLVITLKNPVAESGTASEEVAWDSFSISSKVWTLEGGLLKEENPSLAAPFDKDFATTFPVDSKKPFTSDIFHKETSTWTFVGPFTKLDTFQIPPAFLPQTSLGKRIVKQRFYVTYSASHSKVSSSFDRLLTCTTSR